MVNVALWWAGDLSRVYPASRPMTAGIGSSPPTQCWIGDSGLKEGWHYPINIIIEKYIYTNLQQKQLSNNSLSNQKSSIQSSQGTYLPDCTFESSYRPTFHFRSKILSVPSPCERKSKHQCDATLFLLVKITNKTCRSKVLNLAWVAVSHNSSSVGKVSLDKVPSTVHKCQKRVYHCESTEDAL